MILLRLAGIQVETCADPRAAIEMARQGNYDLILCDLCMPGITGLSLLPRLRQAAPTADVVVMSALAEQDWKGRALAQGAVGFLQKPFDRDALTACLKSLLKAHAHA